MHIAALTLRVLSCFLVSSGPVSKQQCRGPVYLRDWTAPQDHQSFAEHYLCSFCKKCIYTEWGTIGAFAHNTCALAQPAVPCRDVMLRDVVVRVPPTGHCWPNQAHKAVQAGSPPAPHASARRASRVHTHKQKGGGGDGGSPLQLRSLSDALSPSTFPWPTSWH